MTHHPVPGRRAMLLFTAAQALPESDRGAFFDRECIGDEGLRREIEALQRHDRTTDSVPVDRPALGTGFHLPTAARRAVRLLHEFPTQVGPFSVTAEIGAGSMGIVYRAVEHPHKRTVALKLLWQDLRSERDRIRFAIEAEALGRLRHPGIAHLYHTGTVTIASDPQPYLAMELIGGSPLGRWARESSPNLNERLRIVVELCQAIDHAHSQGVLHRDLKPDNILIEVVDGRPRPRILDFGVAKLLQGAPTGSPTEPTHLAGTPAYMSPEQRAGSGIDQRSDVFAIGVIACELLTELPPEEAIPPPSTFCSILKRSYALRRSRARELYACIRKAMAARPGDRYANARDYAADLTAWAALRPLSAMGQGYSYVASRFLARHRLPVMAAAMVAALCVLLVVSALRDAQRSLAGAEERLRNTKFLVNNVIGTLARQAGTTQTRTEALARAQLLANDCTDHFANDVELLGCQDRILRDLGDMAMDAGRWQDAVLLRRESESICQRLRELMPESSLATAEWATAVVRIGDAELAPGDLAAAVACYETAHVVYEALAQAHPNDARHIDDLSWSYERLAVAALRVCDLNRCRYYLDHRERLLVQLERLRPDAVLNIAGRRALFSVRSFLALEEGDHAGAVSAMATSLAAARMRLRREVNNPHAIVDFAASALCYLNLGLDTLDAEKGGVLRREGEQAVTHLLAQDPENREARNQLVAFRALAVHFP